MGALWFFDGFKQDTQTADSSRFERIQYEGYKHGISNANSGEDIGTDEIPDICSHFTQQWCAGWLKAIKNCPSSKTLTSLLDIYQPKNLA